MKLKNVEFQEKQEPYKYQMQTDKKTAVVFIREFIEERTVLNENGEETILFIYNQNEFIVKTDEITEDMIKEDPLSWIDYEAKEQSFEEQILTALNDIGEVLGGII